MKTPHLILRHEGKDIDLEISPEVWEIFDKMAREHPGIPASAFLVVTLSTFLALLLEKKND